MKKQVICLGVSTLDQIFQVPRLPKPPAKLKADAFIVTGGGMAANAAVAVQRLGGQAQYWGRVGDDLTGEQVLGLLDLEGVDRQQVRKLSGAKTKVAAILIDEAGERLIISSPVQGYPSDVSWLPMADVAKVDAVLADTRWLTGARAIFEAAHQHNKPSVFDADGGVADAVLSIAQHATHPVFSETMLAELAMGPPEEALPRAFGGYNQIIGVTLGGEGAVWFDGKSIKRCPAPKINVVDTLAAGDTFHGALALALAEQQPIAHAMRFATYAAALKCTVFGGRVGIPTRAQLDSFLA
jgi:sulfofructose kinase